MRILIRILSLVVPAGWIAYLAFDGDALRPVHWINEPSPENWLALGLLALGGLAWGLTARPTSRRAGLIAIIAGLIAVGVGYFGSHSAEFARSELIAPLSFGGGPAMKPHANETIVGYYYLTPHEGGPAAFANGSALYLTADEFLAARKAEPPHFEPAWRSPTKPRPGTPPTPAKESDAQRMVRQAAERSLIGSDLKQLVTAHFYAGAKPPLDPEALASAAKLDARQRAALDDGTYVWFFGWTGHDLDAVARYNAAFRRAEQLGWLAWSGFLLCGVGAALTIFGFAAMSRSRPSSPAAPKQPGR